MFSFRSSVTKGSSQSPEAALRQVQARRESHKMWKPASIILLHRALPIELPLNYFRNRIGFQGHLKVKAIKPVLEIEIFSARKPEARRHIESKMTVFHS